MQLDTFRVYSYPGWGKAVELRSMLPLIAPNAPRTWIHCGIEGVWKGHPNGPFEFTQEVFGQIRANLKNQINSVIPLHYGHPDYKVTPEPEPAGYVHDFAIRDDGLWALVELFPETAEQIRAGKFRFCSVVVRFDSVDRKSGEPCGAEVFEIGLTNSPFIDGLTPIKLSRSRALPAVELSMADKETKDADALWKEAKKRAGENADPRKMLEVYTALVEFEERMKGAGGEPEPPAEEAAASVSASQEKDDATKLAETDAVAAADPVVGAETELMTLMKQALNLDAAGVLQTVRDNLPKIVDVLGLPPSETADSAFSRNYVPKEVFETVASELKLAREQLAPLKTKVDDGAKERAQKDAEARVDALISENRKTGFAKGERERLVAMALSRPKDFETLRESLPPMAVPFGQITERVERAPGQTTSLSRESSKDAEEVDLSPRDDTERLITGQIYDVALRAKALKNHRARQLAR